MKAVIIDSHEPQAEGRKEGRRKRKKERRNKKWRNKNGGITEKEMTMK